MAIRWFLTSCDFQQRETDLQNTSTADGIRDAPMSSIFDVCGRCDGMIGIRTMTSLRHVSRRRHVVGCRARGTDEAN